MSATRRRCWAEDCRRIFLAEGNDHYCYPCRLRNQRREARRTAAGRGITARTNVAMAAPIATPDIANGTERTAAPTKEVTPRAAIAAPTHPSLRGAFRHPSGRPRLVLVKETDLCHHGQSALTCEGCIQAGELDWENREDPA